MTQSSPRPSDREIAERIAHELCSEAFAKNWYFQQLEPAIAERVESALQSARRAAIEEAAQYMEHRALELTAASVTSLGKVMADVYRAEAKCIRNLEPARSLAAPEPKP